LPSRPVPGRTRWQGTTIGIGLRAQAVAAARKARGLPARSASLPYVTTEPLDEQLDELAVRISPRILRAPARTDAVRRQLDAYFEGRRRAFELPIDWRLVRGFAGDVLRATARIPFGQVSSYREIAVEAGSPRAYRAAGNALGSNPIPIVVPCHRVLHAGGGLGGYTGGLDRKRFLLRLEGALGG
jgi:methylated-DNA-[protein]-cysteine S-methyltransferase